MKKYNFEFVKENTYKLSFTNKNGEKIEKEFVRDVETAKKLQQIQAKARLKMLSELSKLGMTKEDLIIKKEVGKGQVIYDETNYKEYEKTFIEAESIEVVNDLFTKCFGMNIIELIKEFNIDINSTNPEDAKFIETFVADFLNIITGNKEAEEEKQPS